MKTWIQKLPIRFKLLFAFGSILLMSVWIISVGISSIQNIISYNELSERINGLNVAALKMSRDIQEFSDRGFKNVEFLKTNESEWLNSYNKEYAFIQSELEDIDSHDYFTRQINKRQLDSISSKLVAYDKNVKSLILTFSERGFQDYGVEGKLRKAIHDVEDSNYPYDKASMLMLRRHEKDFFLRKDLKYKNRFNDQIEKLTIQVDSMNLEEGKSEIKNSIKKYQSQFNYIIELESKIGLDSESGLLGAINSNFESFENVLSNLTQSVKSKNQEMVQHSLITLFALLTLQIIVGLILVIFYANLLTKAINEIKSALVSLSKGSFPENMVVRTKDEIAYAKHALNNLVERIKAAVQFAQDLGKGNLNIEYKDEFKEDVLATAIIKMKSQLVEADKQQRSINWLNEGMAKFSEILKNNTNNISELGDEIISQLVNYLGVNQGAIYVINEDENCLESVATYAYNKKKYEHKKIQIGQGLVGQSVLEKSYILLKEVPEDYIKITSGLGEATARNVIIVPLMINDEAMGVIELASFQLFSELEIKFINRVSESIANILSSKKIAERTLKLLDEAQEKAVALSAQDEELRQNSEELQATQEEMERQRTELLKEVERLENELGKSEIQISDLRNRLTQKEKEHLFE
ncbi:GAF domain-containing protein [Fulvivirga lutea]|uniref:GAF domain-containing protein n=1 Tax=Fulvivirga lutea TaxID=2810512 RepID=A0A974WI20_9BACT|nr:GAF domain-containing protein [Fulvivirga lutea]QSE98138.1 GAF domain-containing protein [Fulvivirga lutea]